MPMVLLGSPRRSVSLRFQSFSAAEIANRTTAGQRYVFGAQAKLGYLFTQTLGNPQMRFIPWHLLSVIDPKNQVDHRTVHRDDDRAEEWFQRWKWGLIEFPWIDAAMRQLRAKGWIHHLARHAAVCSLTCGGCYIEWEQGAENFRSR